VSDGPGAPAAAVQDRETLSILEEERDFLLRSLDDLEREREAGDVDDHDYTSLRDDYTARAAAVLRAIEEHADTRAEPEVREPRPRRQWGRTLGWIAVVGVFAVVAGLLMARASGSRGAGDTATGDISLSTRQLLVDAQSAAAQKDYDKSIDLYTQVLKIQPSNVEALTYRAWSRVNKGDAAGAQPDLDAAVEQDPTYPDVRVFRAVVDLDAQRYDDAAKELDVFDTLDAPAIMKQLVVSRGLRDQIVAAKLLVPNPPPFASVGLTIDQVRAAAEALAEQARLADALKLFDIVLAADPADTRAHAYKGWALARAGVQAKQTQLIDTAMASFDRALQLAPANPDAHVFRAFTLFYGLDRAADAKADLAAFDALADRPASLVSLIEDYGLRAAIDAKLKTG
jgi:tetratricopeptide (TPR) repeat protein